MSSSPDLLLLDLCRIQGDCFSSASSKNDRFIVAFLSSDISKSMDDSTYFSLGNDAREYARELGLSLPKKNQYTPEVMHWMGYLYRYIANRKGVSSLALVHALTPSMLASFYLSCHTADNEKAMGKIISSIKGKISPILYDKLK